jgi:hypothetical protein
METCCFAYCRVNCYSALNIIYSKPTIVHWIVYNHLILVITVDVFWQHVAIIREYYYIVVISTHLKW